VLEGVRGGLRVAVPGWAPEDVTAGESESESATERSGCNVTKEAAAGGRRKNRSALSSQGQNLVEHLLRTKPESGAPSVSASLVDGQLRISEGLGNGSVAHEQSKFQAGSEACPSVSGQGKIVLQPNRSFVKFIVQFDRVQVGVETEPQAKGPKAENGELGVERCVLTARSAVLKQIVHLKDAGAEGVHRYDETFLEVFGLDSYVVLQAPDNWHHCDIHTQNPSQSASGGGASSWASKSWGPTVWVTDQEQDRKTLRKCMSISGVQGSKPVSTKVAMSLSLTKRVTNLIGDAPQRPLERGKQNKTAADNDGGDEDELNAGAEVEVILHHVEMATDTSQTVPILNCLSAMMTPTPADKRAAEETEQMRLQVQLEPQVAKEMGDLQENEARLVQEVEKMQNQYAEIEQQEHLDKKMARKYDQPRFAAIQSEKTELKTKLHEKRSTLARIRQKITALKTASDENRKHSEIKQITLKVLQGVWELGPTDRRLARISLQGLTHVQMNDIEKGLPIDHKFQLKFFQIESLLSDQWNEQYRQVLGPYHSRSLLPIH
jgi:hypothetical protein